MREVTIGDFVATVLGVNGILIDVRNTPLWHNCIYRYS